MPKYKYRTGQWCDKCKKEIGDLDIICPDCGNGIGGTLRRNATIRLVWVDVPFKWYSPSTWSGGYWQFDGIGKKMEGVDEPIL